VDAAYSDLRGHALVHQDSEGLSLEQFLGVLRRRLPLIALCVIIAAGVAYGVSKHKTKKYTATASLTFSINSLSQQIAGLSATTGTSLLAQQASDLELVKLGDMAAKTASRLGHGLTAEKVAKGLSIQGQGESGVVDVSATATSPALAAAIADTYTNQFVKEQEIANRQYFQSALALVKKQLEALSPAQRVGGDGLALQNRAQTLGLLAEMNDGNVQVAQEALPPTQPSSPKTSRNTGLGALLGLILGLGVAFLLERLDRRIRRPGELEMIYELPLLGAVPKAAALSQPLHGQGESVLQDAEADAFGLIRAHLRFFNVDRDLRTVVIASPVQGDGKSTIACHLAAAAARLGSRVLLMEVDLRCPTLSQQFGLEPGPGLVDVLIGAVTMGEATQQVRLETTDQTVNGRTLDVLTAGSVPPPNPGELLESYAMDAMLVSARSGYDLVVVDTPPLNAVSDAFPLLTKVDGVVVVGWIGRSRCDAAEELHQVLTSSGAPLLGVIANGSSSPGGRLVYPARRNEQAVTAVASSNGTHPAEELTRTTGA
jgi:capsular exopolysaccharide synthesis family protein